MRNNESELTGEGQGNLSSSVTRKSGAGLSSQAVRPTETAGKAAVNDEGTMPGENASAPKPGVNGTGAAPEKSGAASPPPFSEKKTKPVMMYIGIMFGAALLLLLFSFLIQQRNHEALMEGLHASAADMQTIVDLERESSRIADQLEEAQKDIAAVTKEKEALEEELAALPSSEEGDNTGVTEDVITLERQRDSLSELLTICHICYVQGNPEGAKLLLNDYQNERKYANLPPHSAVNSTVSPHTMYEALVAYLNEAS